MSAKSAATGYTDFYKRNTSGSQSDTNNPMMKTQDDSKKDAIRRRLKKMREKKASNGKSMKEF